jgi:hypothetical protein
MSKLSRYNSELLGEKRKILSIDPGLKNYGLLILDTQESKIVHSEVLNVSQEEKDCFSTLSEKLFSLKELLEQVDLVVIEKQPPLNEKLLRIEQHTVSFFFHSLRKPVISLSPRQRIKILSIGKVAQKSSKPEIRKFVIDFNKSLVKPYDLSPIEEFKAKKVHLYDCFSQIIAILKVA